MSSPTQARATTDLLTECKHSLPRGLRLPTTDVWCIKGYDFGECRAVPVRRRRSTVSGATGVPRPDAHKALGGGAQVPHILKASNRRRARVTGGFGGMNRSSCAAAARVVAVALRKHAQASAVCPGVHGMALRILRFWVGETSPRGRVIRPSPRRAQLPVALKRTARRPAGQRPQRGGRPWPCMWCR